jgi:hypothetical protein
MVDYSKWDKMKFSDDEEEGGPDDDIDAGAIEDDIGGGAGCESIRGAGNTRVHRFDQPTTVSIGPSGATASSSGSGAKAPSEAAKPALPNMPERSVFGTSKAPVDEAAIAASGSILETHSWHQSRDEVVLYIPVFGSSIAPGSLASIKAADLTVTISKLPESSSPAETASLSIINKRTCDTIINKPFKFRIALNSEDGIVDWELIRFPRLLPGPPLCGQSAPAAGVDVPHVKIVLKKFQYIPNSVFWWSCVFEGDPTIDVTKIAARHRGHTPATTSTTSIGKEGAVAGRQQAITASKDDAGQPGSAFQVAFQEAQAAFLERVKQREAIPLHLGDEAEVDRDA